MERWHSTLKKFLDKHPARTLPELQRHLDEFFTYYNEVRPHRARGRITPAVAYAAREKATPAPPTHRVHYRVRHDIVDQKGKVSIRFRSKMLHINVGYRHRGQRVILHVVDTHVRVLTWDFKLLGEATLDERQSYQPMRRAE